MKKSKRIFYNYLISYVILLFLPLIFLSIVINSYYMGPMLEQIILKNKKNVEMAYNNFTAQVKVLDGITQQINMNSSFQSNYIGSFGGSFLEIQNVLNAYRATNPFVSNIVFYSKATDLMYDLSIYSSRHYYEYVYVDESTGYQESMGRLLTSVPAWIPQTEILEHGTPKQIISYIVPVEKYYSKQYFVRSSMIFRIDHRQLLDIVQPIIAEHDTKVIIFAGQTPIFSNNRSFLQQIRLEELSVDSDSFEPQVIKGEKYILVNKSDEHTGGYTIMSFLPYASIVNEIRMVTRMYGIAVGVSLLAGILLITLFIRLNYKPVAELAGLLKLHANNVPAGLNEFEMTKYAVENLIDTNNSFRGQNNQYAKEKILLEIINHTIEHKEVILDRCEACKIRTDRPFYIAFILNVDMSFDKFIDFESKISLSAAEEYMDVYYVEFFEQSNIIFIAGCEKDTYEEINDYINYVMTSCHAEGYKVINTGVGSFVRDIFSISDSYTQAALAFCFQDGLQKKPVVYAKDINLQEANERIDHESILNVLFNAIINLNGDKGILVFNTLEKMVFNEENKYARVILCSNIFNTCIRALKELRLNYYHLLNFMLKLRRLENESINDWKYMMHAFKTELFHLLENAEMTQPQKENMQEKVCTKTKKDIEAITAYINRKYLESDFSIQMIAEHFEISLSNLSHFFKKRTNMNVSEYITLLKINMAKKLLRETDMSVTQIVKTIGYYQASGFIRKFKKVEGCTPGEFRKNSVFDSK